MTKIIRAGQPGALDHIQAAQAIFRRQIAALTDAVRQLGGAAEIGSGAVVNDPLSAPYVLYVNFYTGSDRFVSGSYSTTGSATERIELQRLECGYTEARPFRTLNRAIIEAGLITAKSYYEAPLGNNDLVSIILMPGASVIQNGLGSASISEWLDGKEPTDAELRAFNPTTTGGVILPRGCSVVAMSSDLRKTILRPESVPTPAAEAADASNRRSIFKVTGTGYYWGLTFMDKVGSSTSHHLLHCFEFASQAELDEFYGKIRTAFAGDNNTGGLDPELAVTRQTEYEIVGPRPSSGSQTIATDTTTSASPYIFNCSIRSNLGLCGIFADGAKPTGFKSMVLAQFTGVSLQRDLSCWQKYLSSPSPGWTSFVDYTELITTAPDNVRMHPDRRSFHIRAINDAIMQEVSVFAIGQGIHHWVQSGGELTVTNSNSNFGGCAALAEGYKTSPFVSDSNWNIGSIRVATNLSEKTGNIRKIYLGTVAAATANDTTTIKLTSQLESGRNRPTVPDLLDKDGYSLPAGSYIWIENSRGNDYRAQLATTAWDPDNPDEIIVTAIFKNQDNDKPGDEIKNSQGFTIGTYPNLAGAGIYIRRLIDTRTVDERRYSLRCNNTTSLSRTPVRDYVLQTTPGQGSISGTIPDSQLLVVAAASSIAPEGAGVLRSASVELRRANASNNWTSGGFYRVGDVVRYQSKLFSCTTQNNDASFDPEKWSEAYVHMETTFKPEDFWKNKQPTIIFDNDSDSQDGTTTCGYNLSTVWSGTAAVRDQYRSAVDYLALHSLLVSLGFSSSSAHTILLPRTSDTRERNPESALDGIASPNGAASGWNNWSIEFRRPSNIRLFGHAWEWSGFLNYTKSLPEYQLELSPLNKFTYYFTNKNGGRVYGSGFNEEGFVVTPQGLQDLATGNEISVENIAERDVPIDQITFPSTFDELSANTITVNDAITVNGSVNTLPTAWGDGFGDTLPELPLATTFQKGILELATTTETTDLTRNDLAVTPEGLGAVQEDFLEKLSFMSDAESIVYVDGSVQRSGGFATYSSIPAAIWTDIRTNSGIHDIDSWTAGTTPLESSEQFKFVRTVVFSTIKQAFDFIDNRIPVTRDRIEIHLYGTSNSNASSIVTCNYTGTSTILLASGTSATRLTEGWGAEHFSGRIEARYGTLSFERANINISGTPTLPDQRVTTGQSIVAANVRISNSRIKCCATTNSGTFRLFNVIEEFRIWANPAYLNNNELYVDFDSATSARVMFAICNTLVVTSRQNLPAQASSASQKLDLSLVLKRTGVVTGKANTVGFVVGDSADFTLDPGGVDDPYSAFGLNFNFTGSNFTHFDFIFARFTCRSLQFSRYTVDSVNNYAVTITNRGALTEFYGIRSSTPITVTWNTVNIPSTPLIPNTVGFLYDLGLAFDQAGLDSAAAYLWELPAGSYRYGLFLADSGDIVSVANASQAYEPPGGSTSTSAGANLVYAGPATGGTAEANFRSLVRADLPSNVVITTEAQTLTNKTLGTVAETIFSISDTTTVDLNPSNGAIQTWTLGANRTATANNFPAGASMMLCVDDGSARTLTWPAITWIGSAGIAPTLATSGFTFIQLWKVSSTLYGMAQQ